MLACKVNETLIIKVLTLLYYYIINDEAVHD